MMCLPPAPPSSLRPGFLELYTGYFSPPTCISLPTQHFLPCFPTALSTMPPPRHCDGSIECVIPVVVENVSEQASKGMSQGCLRGWAERPLVLSSALINNPTRPLIHNDNGHEDVGVRVQGSSPSSCLGHGTILSGPPVLICDARLRISIILVLLGH